MPNLSQLKRQRMLAFLDKIKEEHKTDDEMLIALGEIANALISKKYGLVWEQHEEKVDVAMQTNIPVFTEVPEREISLVPDNRYNFLLEGDNLHSLYLLEKTHKGAIDLIYIDPPYNTGHEDFVYDDNYVAEEDSFRHSKWLSFMEKRLLIAKELLSEKGVIFIQISDNEVAQLKCLCDDIFGESNFLNIISVNMKNIAGASGGGEDKRFKKNCEYILVYAKSYDFLPLFNGAYTYTEMSSVVEQYRAEGKTWHYTSVLVEKGDKKYVGSTVDGDGNEIKIYTRKNAVIKSVKQIINLNDISYFESKLLWLIDKFDINKVRRFTKKVYAIQLVILSLLLPIAYVSQYIPAIKKYSESGNFSFVFFTIILFFSFLFISIGFRRLKKPTPKGFEIFYDEI